MAILKKYEVVNGRWNAPNLNMKTNAEHFDLFINIHRLIAAIIVRKKRDLSMHNYKFKKDGRA